MDELQISFLDKYNFNSVYFEITSYCNAKCPYCYNNSSRKGKHVPFSNIIDVIQQAYRINPKTSFVFSGGEPLLHPNIIDIISYTQQYDSDVTIITNACLIKKMSFYDVLKKCNIQVTIETLNEREHDSVRGIQSFNNIVNLQNYVPNIYNKKRILRVNLTESNINYIEKFAEFAHANQYTILSFGFLVNQGRGKNNKDVLDYEEDNKICLQAINDIKKCSEKYKNVLVIERKNCYPKLGCELIDKKNPSMSLRIDANGDTFPCLFFFHKNHSLGNIYFKSLFDILKGQQFLELLNSLLYRESHIENCKYCIWEKQCRKGCPALAFSTHNTLNERISCSFNKEAFEKVIKSKYLKIKSLSSRG